MVTVAIGDALGRRRTIFWGTIIQVIGVVVQVTAWNVPQIIVGRVITGLGVGALTSTIPTYQSETCPVKSRGKVVAVDCTMTLVGVVIAYWYVPSLALSPRSAPNIHQDSIMDVHSSRELLNGVSRSRFSSCSPPLHWYCSSGYLNPHVGWQSTATTRNPGL